MTNTDSPHDEAVSVAVQEGHMPRAHTKRICKAYLTTLLTDPRVKEEVASAIQNALTCEISIGGQQTKSKSIMGPVMAECIAGSCLDALARMTGGKS